MKKTHTQSSLDEDQHDVTNEQRFWEVGIGPYLTSPTVLSPKPSCPSTPTQGAWALLCCGPAWAWRLDHTCSKLLYAVCNSSSQVVPFSGVTESTK